MWDWETILGFELYLGTNNLEFYSKDYGFGSGFNNYRFWIGLEFLRLGLEFEF